MSRPPRQRPPRAAPHRPPIYIYIYIYIYKLVYIHILHTILHTILHPTQYSTPPHPPFFNCRPWACEAKDNRMQPMRKSAYTKQASQHIASKPTPPYQHMCCCCGRWLADWLADELVFRLNAGWIIRCCFACLGVCFCFELGGRLPLNMNGNVLHCMQKDFFR